MNKKDLSELKKHLTRFDDLLTIRSISTTFIDQNKEIRCHDVRGYHEIPDEESSVMVDSITKVLKGTLGKGLVEYEFPNEMYEEDQSQNLLWVQLQKGFFDEDSHQKFIAHMMEKLDYALPYALFLAECTYTVFQKDKFGAKNRYDSIDYRFILCAVCPVEPRVDGLIYDEENNTIVRKLDFDHVVADAPTDGFLFPTFTGRAPDVNHVLYYTKKPKTPNISMIEEVLGCHFTLSADEEKETFRAILDKTVGEELNLQVIASVNEKIQDYAKTFKDEPEPPVITDTMLRDILLDCGVSQDRSETACKLYHDTAEERFFLASNLAENKTTLSAEGLSVSLSGDATNRVTTRVIDGRKYLMISIDDPEVTVNGYQMSIQ